MTEKNRKYSKKVIDIADFIYKHPEKKISEVITVFCGKFRKTSRTIEGYIKDAREYNSNRISKQERVRDEVLISETKEAIKKAILTRDERLEILSKIVKSKAREGDRIRAIAEMNKMQGDYAPEKIENSVKFSDPFSIMRKLNGIND